MTTHDLTDTYVHLGTGPELSLVDVTPEFWGTIHQRTELHTGRLVTGMTMDTDWDVWEMHPAGDELIVVTEGAVHVHVDDDGVGREFDVDAPEYFVVPAGVWHTMDARGPARMVVVTWGEGTQHRTRELRALVSGSDRAEAAEAERVRDDEEARERHRGSGDHG
jgi:mannose-6-phosphate isomerase-like protein (cupin superfamily)